MKKVSLRVLSVLLTVALLCGLLPVMGLFGTAEAAADGVTYYDGNAVVIKPDTTGDASFSLVMTSNLTVAASTRYTISYKVRIPDAGVSVWPNLEHVKTSGTTAEALTAHTVTGATNGWQTVSFDIVTAEDQTALNVRLTAKGGLVYVDDLSVSVSGTAADNDYEAGLNGAYTWDFNSVVANGGSINTALLADGGVDGSAAVSVETTGAVIFRPVGSYIAVAASTVYEYSFDVKLSEGVSAYAQIVTEKTSGTAYDPYSSYKVTGTADGKWQTVTMQFTTYEDVTSIHPGIQMSAGGTMVVDNVSLRKVEGNVNHIVNGDFELGENGAAPTGSGAMGAGSGGTYVKVDGAGVDGSAAVLATPTDNGSLYFRPYNAYIKVKASTTYVVNFRFKASADVSIQGFSTSYNTSGNTWPTHNTVTSDGSEGWQSGTIEFTTNADTTSHEFNLIVKGGPAYLDNVVMTEKDYVPTNLVTNGDFEDGADGGWPTGFGAAQLESTDTGKMIRVSGAGVDGSAAALIEAQGYYAMAKDVVVDPSSTYRISYVVKIPSAEASLTPYICQYKDADKNDSDIAPKIIPYANIVKGTCDWTEVEFTIDTASDAALLQLRLMAEGGEVYMDDLKVSKVNNLVYNGNLEEGTTGWEHSATFSTGVDKEKTAEVVTDNERGGQVLKIEATENHCVGTVQGNPYWVSLEASATYRITYWIKQEGENVYSNVMMRQSDGSTGNTANGLGYAYPEAFTVTGATDWKKHEVIWRADTDGATVALLFEAYTGTVYIDDLCMEKLPVVINGDFENGTTGWGNAIYGTDGSFAVTADAERGNVLKIDSVTGYGVGSNQGTAYYIHVEPSTEYRVSYWLKMEDNADPATTVSGRIMFRSRATASTDSGSPYAQPTNFQFSGATDGWVKVEERYTTSSTCALVSIIFGAYNGTVYIDDVTMEKVADNPIDNGSFEDITDGIPTGFAGKGMVTGTSGSIASAPAEARFVGANATLGEDIALNLHIKSAFAASSIKVELDAAAFTKNAAQTTLTPELVTGTQSDYMVTVRFPAKNMADSFTAKLYVDGVETDSLTYSVKEYAMSIYTDANGVYAAEAEKAAAAMLNYGAKAQAYFGYNAESPANADLAEADQTVSVDNIAGITKTYPEATEHYNNTNVGTFYGSLMTVANNVEDTTFGTIDTVTATAEVPAGRSFQYQSMTATTTGTSYVLSFWAKVSTGTVGLYPLMYTSDWGSNQNIGTVTLTTEWKYFTLAFTASNAYTTVQINNDAAIASGTVISIAGLSLKNKVDDGNLYAGAALQTYYGDFFSVGSVYDATYGVVRTATAKVDMGTDSDHPTRTVRLLFNTTEAGKTYEVSFMAKSSSGTVSVMPIIVGNGIFEGRSNVSFTEEWQRVTFTYTNTNTWGEIQFQPTLMYQNTVLSFADISIREADTTTIEDYLPAYSAKLDVLAGYTLMMRDTTSVRLYFNSADAVVTLDGAAEALPLTAKGDLWYAEVLTGVGAKDLDTTSEVTITYGGESMTISNLSVLSPAALAATAGTSLADVSTALILYAEAVNALV